MTPADYLLRLEAEAEAIRRGVSVTSMNCSTALSESQSEVEMLLGTAGDTTERIALSLGARCDLRSHEVLDVSPEHVVDTDAGAMLRVYEGKGDKYRETPVPRDLATTIRTVDDIRAEPSSASLVDITSTRSLRRWVRRAADNVDDDDEGWSQLTFHDLRRT